MSLPVFLTTPGALAGAATGATVTLEGDEARHAVQVRRIRSGEDVELVDGAGRRVRGTVTTATSSPAASRLELLAGQVLDEPAPSPRLVLVQALAKGGRDEQAVTMACEIGIDAVVPWQAQRCVARWDGARAAKGHARWQAVVEAAAKQSRRAHLPAVAPLHTSLAPMVAEVVADGGTALVLHEQATVPIAAAELPTAAADHPMAQHAAPQVLVVVGPEGGITDAELTELSDAGAQVVRLGPHVLRSATAGPVASAVLAQRLGRWDDRGAGRPQAGTAPEAATPPLPLDFQPRFDEHLESTGEQPTTHD